ncbi:MAG: hypothetical protein ABI867_13650 [Kofleriaceae bacterium]
MRRTAIVLGLLASACMRREYGDDGNWDALDRPCVRIDRQVTTLVVEDVFELAAAGESVVFGTRSGIHQVSVHGGDHSTIALAGSTYNGPVGVVGNALVYYDERRDTGSTEYRGVVIDRGFVGDAERYQWVSEAEEVFGLVVMSAGAYWTERTGATRVDRRWDPESNAITDFELPFGYPIATNGSEFLIRISGVELAIQPVGGGPREIIPVSRAATPAALAPDGEAYFTLDADISSTTELVAKPRGGDLRVLVQNQQSGYGVLLRNHYYWTQGLAIMRVPRDGSRPAQSVYQSPEGGVAGLASDGCNLYWREDTNRIRAMSPD